jgi:raffinose/stachyose/melibiose transport system substrate-binding protein
MQGLSRVSRRGFLHGGLALTGAAALAACGQAQAPPATPQVIEKVVTQVVEKQVEKQVTQVVEKQVTSVVTQVVEKQVQVVVTPTALAQVTLDFWYSKPEFKHPLENIMKLFRLANANVVINVTTFGNEEFEPKLKTALAAGTAADMWADRAQPGLADRVKDGQFLELTKKVDTSMMYPLAVNNGTDKGKLWAVCVGGFAVGMGYDAEFFDQNGLKPPTTWDEWTALNTQIKKLGKIPIINAGKEANHTYWVQQGLWDSVLGEAGFEDMVTGKRKITDPDLVAAVKLFVDWNDAGFIQKGMLGTQYEEAKAMFATNKGEISSSGPDDFKGYLQVNPKGKWLWFAFPPPNTSGGKADAVAGNDPTWVANLKTKSPDSCVKFLDWAVHQDGQQAFVDLYGGLPVISTIKIDDPIRQTMVETPEHVTAWFHRVPTSKATDPFQKNSPAVFLHEMTPEQYCASIQKAIDDAIQAMG